MGSMELRAETDMSRKIGWISESATCLLERSFTRRDDDIVPN